MTAPPRQRYIVRTTAVTVRSAPFTDAAVLTRLRRGALFYGVDVPPTGRLRWVARESGGYVIRVLVDVVPDVA